MEENNKKKKKILPLIITCIVAVFAVAFVGLCVSGILPVPTQYGVVSLDTAMLIKKADDVQDEETLRALLLLDQELEITVTKDIELSDTLEVVNTKTLKGDAKLSYNITGLFAQGSVLEVQKKAHLIMDGLVLSGEGMADAVKVNQRAELTYKSGTIEYVRYGITTNGKVTVEDITVKHVATAAIFANFRSDVVVNKGYFYNSYSTTLQVENGGFMEIHEGVVIEQSGGTAINNVGDLAVYGCTIKDTVGSGINNEGNMTIEYKGSRADGMIEMENIGKIALRIDSSDDTSIKDVHVNGTGTNGVFVTDKVTKGSLTLANSIFENTGDESGNTFSIAGNATIKDVTIKGSQKGSFYVREKAKVTVSGLTIENCTGNAMSISGELVGDGITINGATGHGIDIARATDKVFGKATLENVTISGVEKNSLLVRAGSAMEIKDSVIGKSTRTGVYVSAEANMTLENVELQGVVDEGLWVVVAAEGANVTIKGDTTITGGTRGGICVEKNATCTMESGTISGINSTGDGAAVYLRGAGSAFHFVGGTFKNNTAQKAGGAVYIGKDATFNMSGGNITGNKATNRGGAVYCMGNMNFTGGTISGNESQTSADGILCKGKVIVSGNAYMEKDDIGVDSAETPVIVKGNTLKKHSAKEPLLITAPRDTKPDTVIAKCDSNNAAVALVTNHVASGTKAYSLYQLESGLAVSANKADMDMTGADTVYVSTFAEFKEAVESTKTKRYVVVKADIAFESEVFVPLGATVYVRDDGQARTLSRKNDMGSNLISTSYGTGLYLVGTSTGKLVIDGATSATKKADQIDPAVRVYGGTEIKNVAFKNNLTSEKGAFVRQDYGDIAIYNSTFTGGKSTDHGGAVYFETGSAIVENCVFENNNATKEGGAIRAQNNKDLVLTIKTSEFKNNTADSHGGAISSGAGTVAVTSSNFTSNITKTGHAGAISVVNAVSVKIDGIGTFKGNSAVDGGAIYTNNSLVSIDGYTFDSNTAGVGGAIEINNGTNNGSDPVSISNVVFTNNTATDKGGAIYNTGRTTNVTDCTFESNTAKGHGGAVYIAGGGTLNFTGSDTARAIFESNTAGSNGGAIYSAKNGTLTADGYTFSNNSASGGAAINMTNDSKAATITNATFTANTASGQGGAIRADGNEDTVAVLTIKDTTFADHTAGASGGAIYTKAETHLTNANFTGNSGSVGGALNICGGKEFTATSCVFTSNKSTRDDVDNVEGGGAVIISGGTSTFDGTGSFTTNDTPQYGGAIFVKNDAVVNIEGYTFTSNTAVTTTTGTVKDKDGKDVETTVKGYAGAIYATGSTVTIKDSKFESNSAVNRGGAIYAAGGSTVTLTGTDATKAIFSKNSSEDNGGAYCIGSGSLTATGYTFDGNTAKNGGAISFNNNAGIKPLLINCIFTGNTATGVGGAIHSNIANASTNEFVVKDSKFDGNTAKTQGGAIWTAGGIKMTLSDVEGESVEALFQNNAVTSTSSNAYGGAIYISAGTVEVDGYTFTSNNASASGKDAEEVAYLGRGGAIYNADGSVKVSNSAFESNTSTNRGGAICNTSTKTVEIVDTSFKNNVGDQAGVILQEASGDLIIRADKYPEKAVFEGNRGWNGGVIRTAGSGSKITITGYKFISNTANNNGGALCIDTGTELIVTNCTFGEEGKANSAGNAGGAIYFTGSAKTGEIVNSSFTGNSAKTGGAIHDNGTESNQIKGSTFTGNTSTSDGGAVYNKSAAMEVTNPDNVATATFTSNISSAWGGAIYTNGGTFTLSGYTVSGNKGTYGGAILMFSASTVSNTTFTNNEATQKEGGAIYNNQTSSFTNCTFNGNKAATNGGAILTNGGKITVTGSTFKANTSSNQGGAIYHTGAKGTQITNCLFGGTTAADGNVATSRGGAIYNGGSGTMNITGTDASKALFAYNSSATGGAIGNGSGTITVTGYAFKNNTALASGMKRGGAIYVSGGTVTLSGTNGANEVMEDNDASNGKIAYVSGGSLIIDGYSLPGTSTTYFKKDSGKTIKINGVSL